MGIRRIAVAAAAAAAAMTMLAAPAATAAPVRPLPPLLCAGSWWTPWGDVNRDSRVTSLDAYHANQLARSGGYDRCADVDWSGAVTSRDVYLIQQAVVGLVELPVV